ncbi:MAG: hypothetical protein ACE5MI_13515, partial [Acidimicrobiia bacterium]
IPEAVEAARGRLIWVMNLVTQDAESLDLRGPDHVSELHRLTGLQRTGTIALHEGIFEVPEGLAPVTLDEPDAAGFGWDLVTADLVDRQAAWPQHHTIRLGQALAGLL